MPRPYRITVIILVVLFTPMVWVSNAFGIPGQPLFVGLVLVAFMAGEIARLLALKKDPPSLDAVVAGLAQPLDARLSPAFRIGALSIAVLFTFVGYDTLAGYISNGWPELSLGQALKSVLMLCVYVLFVWVGVTGKVPRGRFWA